MSRGSADSGISDYGHKYTTRHALISNEEEKCVD